MAWRTRKRGTPRQIGRRFRVRRGGRIKTMFFEPTHVTYAEVISLRSPEEARFASKWLLNEFKTAETRAKKRRVKKVTVLASNRAFAMAKKGDLSGKEKVELKKIGDIYKRTYKRMRLD